VIRLVILFILIATPAFADEARYCSLRPDGKLNGCSNVDPAISTLPEGWQWVPDPNAEGSPELGYDLATGTFLHAPLTPEQQQAIAANQAKELRDAQLKALADVQDLANRLKTATPAQIDTWVDGNVNNVAQARTLFKAILKLLAYSLRVD
jgi:hypothetical protein